MVRTLLVVLVLAMPFDRAVAETSDEQAIESIYNSWVKVTNEKDIDLWATYLAPSALFLPPDSGALKSHEAIRQYYVKSFEDPNFALVCRQIAVEISSSSDMAWATGTCEATFTGPNNDVAHGASKWAKVWVKQSGGTWKCRLNTWNNNP